MLRKMSSVLVALGLGAAFTVLKFAGPKSSEIPVVPLAAKQPTRLPQPPSFPPLGSRPFYCRFPRKIFHRNSRISIPNAAKSP